MCGELEAQPIDLAVLCPNNSTVFRPVARALALLLVAPVLTFAAALAPAHVHKVGPGGHRHDHRHPVAHSHFAPHQIDVHHGDVTEIEHDIEHVIWLESAILHKARYSAAPAPTTIAVRYDVLRIELRRSLVPFTAAARAHGPPRHTILFRGPPPPSPEQL